ncbi:MAG: cysteine synthase family protein [Caldilineales bacterium]|nr:cysteine synthase family protein [Caldilineales bacterium]MDW8316477.1 cysteine synthase family protein [Anaerolineae bacterium]
MTLPLVLTRSPDIVWAVAPERPYRPASILEQIGNTPLLDLSFLVDKPGVELYAKAEWFNPGGSVKDRAALRMIEDAERSGRLRPGQIIIDATSGNTGIGYALIGAAKGYAVHLVMPANVTVERKALAKAYGAHVIESDPLEGTDGAIRLVRQIVAAEPEAYFYPDQYNNDSNWRAHYDGTGPEILCQTNGRVTHFVAGLGTTGTFMGVGRRLKEVNPAIQLIAVQPADELQVIEGLKHMATSIVPGIYDPALADRHLPVEAGDAWAMARRLARAAGLLVGFSAAAAVHAAAQVARELSHGVVVTVLPDSGTKYLSLGLFG